MAVNKSNLMSLKLK